MATSRKPAGPETAGDQGARANVPQPAGDSVPQGNVPDSAGDSAPNGGTPDLTAARARRRKRRLRALRSLIFRTVGLALVLYVLLFHLVGLTVMPSGDMYPRLDAGDLVLFYRLEKNYRAQDIVVFDKAVNADGSAVEIPERPDPGFFRKALNWLGFRDPDMPETQRFICRIIAAPGDTVDISDEQGLLVNGNGMIETNIFYRTRPYEGMGEYPVTLGEDEYFVLADFRNGGADSRFFGPVKAEEIQGVVITILRRNNL